MRPTNAIAACGSVWGALMEASISPEVSLTTSLPNLKVLYMEHGTTVAGRPPVAHLLPLRRRLPPHLRPRQLGPRRRLHQPQRGVLLLLRRRRRPHHIPRHGAALPGLPGQAPVPSARIPPAARPPLLPRAAPRRPLRCLQHRRSTRVASTSSIWLWWALALSWMRLAWSNETPASWTRNTGMHVEVAVVQNSFGTFGGYVGNLCIEHS